MKTSGVLRCPGVCTAAIASAALAAIVSACPLAAFTTADAAPGLWSSRPGISLVKAASPTTFNAPGQTIRYRFAVTNTGNVTLTRVGIRDTRLPGLSPISCRSKTLAPRAHETCTATYVTTQANVDAGTVRNTATAHGDPPGSMTPVVSAPSTTMTRAVQSPGITLVKTASPTTFSGPGQTITYSFAVTNTGNVTLSSVGVTDTDMPGLSAISCPDSSLPPGTAQTCTATLVTNESDLVGAVLTNTATAHGLPPGSTTPLVSAPSSATVFARQFPGISVSVSASPATFSAAGQTIIFQATITDTGDTPLATVHLDESIVPPNCDDFDLEPGQSGTCAVLYTTTQADVDAGSVTDTVIAQGFPLPSVVPLMSAPSSITVPLVQSSGTSRA